MALTLERHTGGTPSHAAVTIVSTEIVANNLNRGYCLIQNDSAVTMYIALNAPAVLNSGIRLNAGGGSYEINYTNLFTGPIYAIHGGAGNANACIQEGR